jgi:hypothetical protein
LIQLPDSGHAVGNALCQVTEKIHQLDAIAAPWLAGPTWAAELPCCNDRRMHMGAQQVLRWLAAAAAGMIAGRWLLRRGAAHAHSSGLADMLNTDVSALAGPIRAHALEADVNPILLAAILHNESYKPHSPLLERAWQKLHRDSALGVANMHRAAYEQTRRGRPFAERPWKDLAHDADLAVRAAAWHLRDLATHLPDSREATYTSDELLAMGYVAGARNMLKFARGASPGPQARAYVDRLREYWPQARGVVDAPASR